MIPLNNITNTTIDAEALGAYTEYNLGIPQRNRCLILRKTTDVVDTVAQTTDRTIEDTYIMYPKVADVPLSYVNLTFSDSTSALSISKSDLMVTIPRLVDKSALVNTVRSTSNNRYAVTLYLASMSDIDIAAAEAIGLSKTYIFGMTDKLVKYVYDVDNIVGYQLPATALRVNLIGVMETKTSLYQLIVRDITL